MIYKHLRGWQGIKSHTVAIAWPLVPVLTTGKGRHANYIQNKAEQYIKMFDQMHKTILLLLFLWLRRSTATFFQDVWRWYRSGQQRSQWH